MFKGVREKIQPMEQVAEMKDFSFDEASLEVLFLMLDIHARMMSITEWEGEDV